MILLIDSIKFNIFLDEKQVEKFESLLTNNKIYTRIRTWIKPLCWKEMIHWNIAMKATKRGCQVSEQSCTLVSTHCKACLLSKASYWTWMRESKGKKTKRMLLTPLPITPHPSFSSSLFLSSVSVRDCFSSCKFGGKKANSLKLVPVLESLLLMEKLF